MSQTPIQQLDGGAMTTQTLRAIESNFADLSQLGGSGLNNLAGNGFISKQISAAGVSPGATAADNVLAVFSIPASALSAAGVGVIIRATGQFAATANNKRVKIIVNPATAVVGSTVGAGGTTIADTGTVATNAGAFSLQAEFFKYGAANSNTQLGINDFNLVANAAEALLLPVAVTATESAAILVAITGNATTATTDILLNALIIEGTN